MKNAIEYLFRIANALGHDISYLQEHRTDLQEIAGAAHRRDRATAKSHIPEAEAFTRALARAINKLPAEERDPVTAAIS